MKKDGFENFWGSSHKHIAGLNVKDQGAEREALGALISLGVSEDAVSVHVLRQCPAPENRSP